jgi:hypothetical protein
MIDALQRAAEDLTREEADAVIGYLERAAEIMSAHAGERERLRND